MEVKFDNPKIIKNEDGFFQLVDDSRKLCRLSMLDAA